MSDQGDTPDDGASPCTLVCTLDADGRCLGCARTIDEIASWGTLTLAARREILAELPARMSALG